MEWLQLFEENVAYILQPWWRRVWAALMRTIHDKDSCLGLLWRAFPYLVPTQGSVVYKAVVRSEHCLHSTVFLFCFCFVLFCFVFNKNKRRPQKTVLKQVARMRQLAWMLNSNVRCRQYLTVVNNDCHFSRRMSFDCLTT